MNNVGTKSEIEFSYFIFLDRHLISWDSSSISWRRVFSALQAIGVEPAIKQLHTLYVSPFMKNIFLSGWEGVIHQINSESEQNPKRHIIFSNLNQLPIYLCLTSLSIASSCNKNKISTTAVEMLSKTMKVGFVTKSEGVETCQTWNPLSRSITVNWTTKTSSHSNHKDNEDFKSKTCQM